MTRASRIPTCDRRSTGTLCVVRMLLLSALVLVATGLEGPAKVEAVGYKLVSSLLFKRDAEAAAWHVDAYQVDVEDPARTEIPARLCISRTRSGVNPGCYSAETSRAGFAYACQFVKTLAVVRIVQAQENEMAVLFVAEFSASGSGGLSLISIWGQAGTQPILRNKLPEVSLSEQSEYRIIPVTSRGHRGVFVTADYVLGPGETHFAPHYFAISIYKLRADMNAYLRIESYQTSRKYPSLDEGTIDVIRYEMREIENRLDRFKE